MYVLSMVQTLPVYMYALSMVPTLPIYVCFIYGLNSTCIYVCFIYGPYSTYLYTLSMVQTLPIYMNTLYLCLADINIYLMNNKTGHFFWRNLGSHLLPLYKNGTRTMIDEIHPLKQIFYILFVCHSLYPSCNLFLYHT